MTAARLEDTAGRAVIETLRAYGIATVFGIPGTHNLELYRPLDDLGMRAITARHEQGAGYAADGWSQQTGLPGVVITTSGPGLQNVMSAVGTAYCESRPLIVLSPGAPREQQSSDRGMLHETKDSSGMAGAVAEWSRRVASAAEAVEAVHDAFELFRTARPRPVHIEIPLDVLEARADVPPEARRARPVRAPHAVDPVAIGRAVDALAAATRPVIIAGGGATATGVEITELAERLGAPVLTTLNGKGVVDERHPLALGANLRASAARAVAEEADVLLVVGSKLGEAELWAPGLNPRGRVIRIDISSDQLHKNVPADVAVAAPAAAALRALLAAIEPRDAAAPDLTRVRARISEEIAAAAPEVVELGARIVSALPRNAIVAGDSSQIVYLAVANLLQQDTPHSLLYMPTYATLGYGLPAAIGARVADPSRPVVTVIGDGALMFCVNELATAAEERLDLTVVCVDNGGYAEIKQNEIDLGMNPVGVDLWQPDWVALAQAFGARATRVDATSTDLEDVLRGAVAADGLNLVHISQTG